MQYLLFPTAFSKNIKTSREKTGLKRAIWVAEEQGSTSDQRIAGSRTVCPCVRRQKQLWLSVGVPAATQLSRSKKQILKKFSEMYNCLPPSIVRKMLQKQIKKHQENHFYPSLTFKDDTFIPSKCFSICDYFSKDKCNIYNNFWCMLCSEDINCVNLRNCLTL